MSNKIAVVTGASSGIGAATARALAGVGYDVVLGARRVDRIEAIAAQIGGQAFYLDVTSAESVRSFCARFETVNVLVNNAGGAIGLEPIAHAIDDNWKQMYDTNVLGLMRVTRGLLPALIASSAGHIVNIGSIAGLEAYPGGAGYTAVKHAVVAISQTLRQELKGLPVRVTEIDPGAVETEFSLVRFGGDKAKADKVYEGITPLAAEDVADAVSWSVTRPSHVNIDQIVIKPLDQVSGTNFNRVVKP
jgi:NADP-dependent 3-hydroxy acid dehydrogenase YdfG